MKNKDIRILLVDDEPDILEIVGYNLSAAGYSIFTANKISTEKLSPRLIMIQNFLLNLT